MKGSIILLILRSVLLFLGIVLSVKWFGVTWWKAWIVFGCFASSATLHLKRDEDRN